VLLLAYDVWAWSQQRPSPDFLRYQEIAAEEPKSSKTSGAQDNQNEYGWKVLSWAMGAVGILVIGLGFIAQNASFVVISMGVTIAILALLLNRRRDYLKKKRVVPRSRNQNKIYP
jgi:hypothetical protein